MANTAYLQDGQVKIVLCGKGTHQIAYFAPKSVEMGLRAQDTDRPCDRCVREGRQIAETR
jgi:hypothetical protein